MIALRQLSLFDDAPPQIISVPTRPAFIYTLSLDQPYASLVAQELKRYETRSWQRSHRGLIAIHATVKEFKPTHYRGSEWVEFWQHIYRLYDERKFDYWGLPNRCILAVADLMDIQPVEAVRDTISAQERAFGGYVSVEKQRYAWKLENVRAFQQPIERAGFQTLWKWTPTDDEWAMIEQLRAA